MSTSRLEKFIYAICSMEVSDLPAPISRIEILWNCLITGETPDFEPQSRNEQYLMAMLGLYELENLPAPMSRGEKLLYKIAMGETDLSDVPGYLSRYEELLGYLAENGGVGDFEYILQTLNQRLSTLYSTKERPVKSAILKGQTLVNISNINKFSLSCNERLSTKNKVQVGKTYLQVIAITKNTLSPANDKGNVASINDSDGVNNFANEYHRVAINETGILKKVYTVTSTSGKNDTSVRTYSITTEGVLEGYEMLIEYQDGMENWDIPYFEGMQSVKMPVLTTSNFLKVLGNEEIVNIYNSMGYSNVHAKLSENGKFILTADGAWMLPNKVWSLEPNTTYTARVQGEVSFEAFFENAISNLRYGSFDEGIYVKFTTDDTGDFGFLLTFTKNVEVDFNIFYGDVTSKITEPYKSNILSTSEDVELRGIGDVQDTLDCLTGEVTERIGEIVLDGSENWKEYSTNSVNTYCGVIRNDVITDYKGTVYLNNKLNKSDDSDIDIEGIRINSSKRIFVRLNRDKGITDLTTFKQYLSQNPITIQYEMVAESIKTVDLTTVDQDGQPTKLKTYNDISHVELSSEGLIPEVELEVATKINETLLTMSPQHHDISETQNKLGQTIDEQTENTDAAMLATTEIYEQTL